ncbi:MAG TPA: hypothetical protein VFO70_01635 [Chitinophagaceae bacterium]|nr:hypothetical protein [Chitinophagaceae bacterium]
MARQSIPAVLIAFFLVTNMQASRSHVEVVAIMAMADYLLFEEGPPAPVRLPSNMPYAALPNNQHKLPLERINELGKIHRFHKDRMKKENRGSEKYWLIIKILIIICHISLLAHAFMHLTH